MPGPGPVCYTDRRGRIFFLEPTGRFPSRRPGPGLQPRSGTSSSNPSRWPVLRGGGRHSVRGLAPSDTGNVCPRSSDASSPILHSFSGPDTPTHATNGPERLFPLLAFDRGQRTRIPRGFAVRCGWKAGGRGRHANQGTFVEFGKPPRGSGVSVESWHRTGGGRRGRRRHLRLEGSAAWLARAHRQEGPVRIRSRTVPVEVGRNLPPRLTPTRREEEKKKTQTAGWAAGRPEKCRKGRSETAEAMSVGENRPEPLAIAKA